MLIPLWATPIRLKLAVIVAHVSSAKTLSTMQSRLILMSLPLLIFCPISSKILGLIRKQLNGKGM